MTNLVSCTYKNGIQTEKDQLALKLAKECGGKFIGSGCWLSGDLERDLEFQVRTAVDANSLMKKLRKAGFDNVSSWRE